MANVPVYCNLSEAGLYYAINIDPTGTFSIITMGRPAIGGVPILCPLSGSGIGLQLNLDTIADTYSWGIISTLQPGSGAVPLYGYAFGGITAIIIDPIANIIVAGNYSTTIDNLLGSASSPWTPGNLVIPPSFWGDIQTPSTLTLVSTTHISAAASRSGALSVTQATDTKRPILDGTGINGHPGGAVTIAAQQKLGAGPIRLVNAADGTWSAFCASVISSIVAASVIGAQDTSATRVSVFFNILTTGALNGIAFNAAGGAFTAVATTQVTPGTPFTAGVVFNGTTITAYLNGFGGTPITFTGSPQLTSVLFSWGSNDRAAPTYMEGEIGELIVLPYASTTPVRVQMDAYLVNRWKPAIQTAAAPITSFMTIRSAANVLGDAIFAYMITEFAGETYLGFFDIDRTPWVCKLSGGIATYSQISMSPSSTDTHDCIAIKPDNAGYLHAWWGMHGSILHYSRSTNPRDITKWTPINTMTGANESVVTYPEPHIDPLDGSLLFLYRTGASGDGANILDKYNPATRAWTGIFTTAFIDGSATPRSAYGNNFIITASYYYYTWTWRDASIPSNSGIFFAQYNRALARWEQTDGTPYAAIPITVLTAQQIVTTTTRLINTCTNTIDASGNLHITFVQDDVGGKSQVFHTKRSGVTITTSQVSSFNITAVNPSWPDISRPTIFIVGGSLWVLVSDGGTAAGPNYYQPPGNTWLFKSTDGLVGATWGTAKQIIFPRQVSEFNWDEDHYRNTGINRFFAQATQAILISGISDETYMFDETWLATF